MSASVFPARAGMSPPARLWLNLVLSVPRASGDEPGIGADTVAKVVFPARAGMSPRA